MKNDETHRSLTTSKLLLLALCIPLGACVQYSKPTLIPSSASTSFVNVDTDRQVHRGTVGIVTLANTTGTQTMEWTIQKERGMLKAFTPLLEEPETHKLQPYFAVARERNRGSMALFELRYSF